MSYCPRRGFSHMTNSGIPNRLSPSRRAASAGIALVLVAMLIAARSVEPDPRGYGTHEQLGLTPCFFLQTTGYVCPTCGATTAWSYTVRGQLQKAMATNLSGTLLCLTAIGSVPWLLVAAATGRRAMRGPSWQGVMTGAAVVIAVGLLEWAVRLLK
jgi:hypothetical protein